MRALVRALQNCMREPNVTHPSDDDSRTGWQQNVPGSGWTPVPDPTLLTNAAIEAVTTQFRREITQLRQLLETRLDGYDAATHEQKDVAGRVRGEIEEKIAHLRELTSTQLESRDKATELLAASLAEFPADIERSVGALRELLGARIDGMDTATKLLASQVNVIPSETDKRVTALRAVLDGEIRNVQDVAQEKFSAIEGTFASNALALTAALAAQKEAAAEQNKSNTLAINKSEQATKEASLANVAQTSSSLASQAATIADLKDRLVRLESGGLATTAERSAQREIRGEGRAGRSEINQVMVTVIMAVSVLVAVVSLIAFALKK